jgi:catechol 2,3-dioxygenase
MESQYSNKQEARESRLHPAVDVGSVTLKVADLQRSVAFYRDVIGLQKLAEADSRAVMGAGERPIVALEYVPGARPQPPNTTGLYHAAILFPDRRSLAVKMAQIINQNFRFGQADHLVSEAFYLNDPDGNGLELYRDRPRSEWRWDEQAVRMAIDPIDMEDFFGEIKPGDSSLKDPAAPSGTKLGHVHLRVASIEKARDFYVELLGFDVTASMPGALFVSAGGYHHHLGLNVWQSRNGSPAPEDSAGLREFSLFLPDLAELEQLADRLASAGVPVERDGDSAVVYDPFRNRIRLVV